MFKLLFAALAVVGCHTNARPDADIGRIDTGASTADTADTADTAGGTTACETLPDDFESTLDRGDSCSDIFIERHNEAGTIQLVFSIDANLAAEAALAMETQVTIIDLAEAGQLRLNTGENLGANACTCEDGTEGIEHTYVAIAGTAEVEITPDAEREGAEGDATVRLSGVVLSDGDSCELTLEDMEFSGGVGLPIG